MSEENQVQEEIQPEAQVDEASTTEPKPEVKPEDPKPAKKKQTRKKKAITIKNMRKGKLFVCGHILQDGEEYTLQTKDTGNKYQMTIVQRLIKLGMIKEI